MASPAGLAASPPNTPLPAAASSPPRSPQSAPPPLSRNEYIPANSPPPVLPVSESMRRMRHMLAAGKITTTDTIHFSYPDIDSAFTATLMEDGSLQSNAPKRPDAPPSPTPPGSPPLHRILSRSVYKLFSSPTEFASEMAHAAVLADQTRARPRGKITINGWDECSVAGRSLASIRNEMLREKRTGATTSDALTSRAEDAPAQSATPVADKSSKDVAQSSEHGKIESIGDKHLPNALSNDTTQNASAVLTTPVVQSKTTADANNETKPNRIDAPKKESTADEQRQSVPVMSPPTSIPIDPAVKQESKPKGTSESCSNTQTDAMKSSTQSADGHQLGAQPSSLPTPRGIVGGKQETKQFVQPIGMRFDDNTASKEHRDKKEVNPDNPADKTSDVASKGHQTNECIDNNFGAFQNEGKGPPGAENIETLIQPRAKSVEAHVDDKFMPLPSVKNTNPPDGKETKNAENGDSSIGNMDHGSSHEGKEQTPDHSSSEKDQEESDKRIIESSSSADGVEPSKPISATNVDAITPRSSSSPGNQDDHPEGDGNGDEDSKDKEHSPDIEMSSDGSEPVEVGKRSSGKHPTRKRKRNDSKESTPSGDNTPSRSPERCTRLRTDGGRAPRKMSVASGVDVDTEGLDPDAMEAAAIAAQAEKEEANSRARRTTRLASGKIKQVDYKASAAVPGQRGSSPGHEYEDAEGGFTGAEFGNEPTRSTRRRTLQNQLSAPQRTSRRVTRQRGSQEKDPSSAEEVDHSAPRRMSSRGSGTDGTSNRADSDAVGVDDDMDIEIFGNRLNGTRADGRERRRYRGGGDGAHKRARHHYREVDDDDERVYATKVSTRENSVVDAEEMTDLGDGNDREDSPEDLEDDANPNTRTDGYGWTMSDINMIAMAVKNCGSTDARDIVESLRDEKGWRNDDVKLKTVITYIASASRAIREMSKKNTSNEGTVRVNDILSFLGMDMWRLRTSGICTGYARRPTSLLNKAHREEVVKNNMERSRKKSNRELDDLRSKLETEMDSRRKVDLDAAYLEIQLREAQKILSREKERRRQIEMEIQRYKLMEADARNRLDRTKLLVSRLRGDNNNGGDIPAQKMRKRGNSAKGECENGAVGEEEGTVGESITSEDDVEMADKAVESYGQKVLEMDRLRGLIAAREAEAEGFQRICEREHSNFVALLDTKNRLESDLYLPKPMGSVGVSGAAIGTSSASHGGRGGKESSRKGDGRSSGTVGNRMAGSGRGKGSAVKGSSVAAGVSSNAKGSNHTGKVKGAPTKNGDSMKGVKRKTTSKSNGVEKPC